MDRAAAPPPADEHWAPDHLVLARRVFAYAGRLVVERDQHGQVISHAPLAGMAAVEHRYPAWARGPFGRIDPERAIPSSPGVFALVQDGTTRYVGHSSDLGRLFSPRGLGEISRREAQTSRYEERCRLNRLVVREAVAGRVVELYLLVLSRPGLVHRVTGRPAQERAEDVAAEVLAAHRGAWHLPG
ncbi:hypothetical protein [Cellulomonas carbonis]|uniref:Uncharacterized protein n=1 Tax=Cellulomonas carbonis T26 TaxID=947969 RepID=A0A0A0BPD9_9CELL|nr:hypothetical protein [Cellulomonas carbonis]KGM09815.1 hypothetical protein N868_18625 [Cellulomonas carbonis T26]GGC01864.1 hypothetical protein GCM10010972_13460 [Cellulomonas carbonis]